MSSTDSKDTYGPATASEPAEVMPAQESSAARVTFGQVLKNKQFLLLWLAQLISNFGDWLAILAVFSLIAFRYHGTSYQVAGIMIAFVIPMAVLGPVAGVFLDRWGTKRPMVSSDLIRGAILVFMIVG